MLFADIDVSAAAHLLEPVTNIRLKPGEVIYRQSDEALALYSIRKGIIKLSVISSEGDLRIVRLLGPGAAIGLEGILQQPYHHEAEALSEVDLCRIPSNSVRQIAVEQPQLCQRLMLQWEKHIELADRHLLQLSVGPINERVVYLLRLIYEICRRSGSPFLLPTNQDCAALVAARMESVSRVMAQLKREGVLSQDESGNWDFHTAGVSNGF